MPLLRLEGDGLIAILSYLTLGILMATVSRDGLAVVGKGWTGRGPETSKLLLKGSHLSLLSAEGIASCESQPSEGHWVWPRHLFD